MQFQCPFRGTKCRTSTDIVNLSEFVKELSMNECHLFSPHPSPSLDTPSPFKLEMDTVTVSPASVETVLVNTDNDVRFRMDISGVFDGTFRVRIREAYPKVPRFEVPHVLDGDPEPATVEVVDRYAAGY